MVNISPKLIYLTGAPATGKSSLAEAVKSELGNVLLFSYGEELTKFVNLTQGGSYRQSDIRALSGNVITSDDVSTVDSELIDFVNRNRETANIIVDSHPVTKEEYGFRITPFDQDFISRLAPDSIVTLDSSPSVIRQRLNSDSGGRPIPSERELEMHNILQASLAAQYSITAGCPAYIIQNESDFRVVIDQFVSRTKMY